MFCVPFHPYIPKSREIFSRVAVVILALGVIMLLAMVIVTIYRTRQSKQLIKGSSRTGLGKMATRTKENNMSRRRKFLLLQIS
ncbi:LRR receptor-like serine/threonine-protein kinase ERL2 [Cicer arietinum]|uniref:LRR receptor-like serine/threonine-protein kinase ERL2 n=1 Tax=Cicer arietinum TaxID=3827 RepID=A0A1S3E527_CICAR|nr:LRR receptor-like serine/threonine-protein kinase ERL2 [Cicer arietinum]XP_027190285.1 LRR receptor-like serine/threonine-protein kinase ERL2 [Cicer arietinum]